MALAPERPRIYEGTRIPSPTPTVLVTPPEMQATGDILTINFGPNHPSTHGVLRLIVDLYQGAIEIAASTEGTIDAQVTKGLPSATVALKWGVPVYQVNGRNVCAIAAFKDAVAINFFASPKVLADPKKQLEGAGKAQRMLKVRSASDIDAASIQRWLKAASAKA